MISQQVCLSANHMYEHLTIDSPCSALILCQRIMFEYQKKCIASLSILNVCYIIFNFHQNNSPLRGLQANDIAKCKIYKILVTIMVFLESENRIAQIYMYEGCIRKCRCCKSLISICGTLDVSLEHGEKDFRSNVQPFVDIPCQKVTDILGTLAM